MASPYQQQAFQRRLIYLGCMLVLFTVTWGWRQYLLADQAKDLGVREINMGDVELSTTLVQLTLTGSRRLATCYLWMTAIDDQKKNQWTELEKDVALLTKMEPHLTTPWLFQSWNLSYNVSVELDRSADKYFYIGRGIELLAKGERQNRHNPDIRWHLGFTYQHKICLHDETNVLRSLFQLSNIPPNQRDPNRFLIVGEDGRSQINWVEFEDFCKENPQLIRRLHSGIQRETDRDTKRQFLCPTPEALIQFLADNYKILSPYETPPAAPPNGWVKKDDRLRDEEDRFPVLPPPATPGRDPRPGPVFDQDALDSSKTLNDGDDAYRVAGAWYGYSIEPIPLPGEMPGENTKIEDRLRQRVPKGMMTAIFRQYPARSASYVAERLQQEGWFDDEAWPVTGWFKKRGDKFSDGSKAEVRVKGRLSSDAWKAAYTKWRADGEANHFLYPTEAAEQNMKDLSKKFQSRYGLGDGALAPNLRKEDLPQDERETIWEEYNAYRFLRAYEVNFRVTNFHHHYVRARVEQEADTVQARKQFYKADTFRINASPREARRMYEQPTAMPAWRTILLNPANKEFREDMLIQEDTAEVQLKYFDLVNEELKPKFQKATQLPAAFISGVRLTADNFPRSLIKSPFLDEKGQPIVEARNMESVEQRRVRPGARPQSRPVEAEAAPTPETPPIK